MTFTISFSITIETPGHQGELAPTPIATLQPPAPRPLWRQLLFAFMTEDDDDQG